MSMGYPTRENTAVAYILINIGTNICGNSGHTEHFIPVLTDHPDISLKTTFLDIFSCFRCKNSTVHFSPEWTAHFVTNDKVCDE